MAASPRWTVALGLAVIMTAGAAGSYLLWRSRHRLPAPGSSAYEDVVRKFYRGLGSLDVGLLDDAKRDFTQAAEMVAEEPASWANLAVAHLRLGEFDPAAAAIQRAAALAPASGEIAFIQGQLDVSSGRLDDAIAAFRHAVELDPRSLRARYALAQEMENAAAPNALVEAQRLLEELYELRPGNLAVLLDRTRLAARRGDTLRVEQSIAALAKYTGGWPPLAVEQLRNLQAASDARNLAEAGRGTLFLRNVLVRIPAFRESLAELKPASELIAEPFKRFLTLPPPSALPSPADETLAFARETAGAGPADVVAAFSPNGTDAPIVWSARGERSVAVVDWNRDFRVDLAVAGASGVKLYLQADAGTFPEKGVRPLFAGECFGVWAADVEMDGDLDLVVGAAGAPVVLRNNGDGTWRTLQPFAGVSDLRGFVWGDVDGDGDPDAVLLDARGAVHVFENRQAGEFREMRSPGDTAQVTAMALGDVDADGVLDLVTLDAAGAIRRISSRSGAGRSGQALWDQAQLAAWADLPRGGAAARIDLADLDNNGALDVVASSGGRSRVWLAGGPGALKPLEPALDGDVTGVIDLNNDGRLDLVGLSGGAPIRFLSRGTASYHWHVVRPRAQPTAGDQRINSFGVGGDIEIRAGLLTQKQAITGSPVHFGLGSRTAVDVTRIVWPNGITQADFDRRGDETMVAEQRLKGSCPWVFTYDGVGMRFVTDFLWRSPLGLRINAQDTAGATQTGDWVKIGGDQLKPRDGSYDVRITAELWETHFIDHASLMVVDHPDGTEMFVDERFARIPPSLTTHITSPVHPVERAWDAGGRDVTEIVREQDGRYLDTFELGPYQGIAREHFVDVDLGREIPRGGRMWLVASGWIYPTDSSINVAIGQGRLVEPHGLSLDAQDGAGRWVVVAPDLGFPAGKNKTILIDLGQVNGVVAHARRLRLRTNLEVYWDRIGTADAMDGEDVRTSSLQAERAELRYRGFSKSSYANRRAPEIPDYQKISNVTQRWRDLVGYYTRFGEVRELLAGVDDRYVIMNAGDELRLSFRAPAPPPAGWTRDFVLVGDGWEKDGDYNTTFSKTVLPLPRHDRPDYDTFPPGELEDDPIYRRHPEDWQTYHTRFVTPRTFLGGLR